MDSFIYLDTNEKTGIFSLWLIFGGKNWIQKVDKWSTIEITLWNSAENSRKQSRYCFLERHFYVICFHPSALTNLHINGKMSSCAKETEWSANRASCAPQMTQQMAGLGVSGAGSTGFGQPPSTAAGWPGSAAGQTLSTQLWKWSRGLQPARTPDTPGEVRLVPLLACT